MVKKTSVLLVTEDQSSYFSRNVIQAAQLSDLDLVISNPDFRAFTQIIEGRVGAIVLDLEELGQLGHTFFRAVRMFHLTTPVLIAGSKFILLDQMMTYRLARNIEPIHLNELILKSLAFNEVIQETEREFGKRIDEIKHLMGNELNVAADKIKIDLFGSIFERKSNEVESMKNSISYRN